MLFKLDDLKYSLDALAPYMSRETLEYHYAKHHQAYVNNLNTLLENNPLKGSSLKEIIKKSYNKEAGIFNNASQHYNHIEFWNSMKNNSNPKIPPVVSKAINSNFNSMDEFKDKIIKAGLGVFGSGWVWLALHEGKLEIMQTQGGVNPLVFDKTPILGCDVWEHTYYIDYRNRRADFLKAWFENLINWEYVEEKLS